jgi:hypothetical protein
MYTSSSEQAVKALLKRLQDVDQKVVNLTIVLSEACTKNCGQIFASFITKQFMDELILIAKGVKGGANQDEALRVIQLWGRSFQSQRAQLPIFYETYSNLRAKGFHFPEEDSGISSLQNDIRYVNIIKTMILREIHY